jgi:hypothetical protein
VTLVRLPVQEVNGLVLVYHGAGWPSWEVPPHDMAGLSEGVHMEWRISTVAARVTENLVDGGDFLSVRRLECEPVEPFRPHGPFFTITRDVAVPTFLDRSWTRGASRALHAGLGYSVMETAATNLGTAFVQFVLPTPEDSNTTRLTIRLHTKSIANRELPTPRVRPATGNALAHSVSRLALQYVAMQVERDRRIFQAGQHAPHPQPAEGEGAVVEFRQWATQFYRFPEIGGIDSALVDASTLAPAQMMTILLSSSTAPGPV